MPPQFPFDQVGRVPAPGDNVAIAVGRLEAGTEILFEGRILTLPVTILEGHRFALLPIATGQPLLSWGLPFGVASRGIAPGDYVCNEKILWALRQRHVDFVLPATANFRDHYVPYQMDESCFRPGQQVPRSAQSATFEGFARDGGRGVGTRNFIAILGTTSRTASFARALAERFKSVPSRFPNIDGVVAIAHTEGGGSSRPNNLELVLRTLAGFMVHPNIGAVLAVDLGMEPVTNTMLRDYMTEHGYPLAHVRHRFWSMEGNFLPALATAEEMVRAWLEPVNGCRRTPQSVEHLRLGLQCGGSDAFSGVSGNPLAGWVSKELIRHGGSANLAETDELIGAEPYVLRNVRDLGTARAFLEKIARFQERAGWHGHTGEGNPSGGNNFRGLYNIAVKSIGAARKKDPDVRLDYVIDYGQPMTAPGFYFMDSPGNDLESIAGQVAAGCNLIVFTTGNGSITNFPFVPTVKVMTSTGRFRMLSNEMDVNAGRYLDGTPMEVLGQESFALVREIASGQRSVGERAGHSQVQLWRDWRQTDRSRLEQILTAPSPNGEPLKCKAGLGLAFDGLHYTAYQTERGPASDQLGLILPTSLCAGQIGRLIADQLNQKGNGAALAPRNGIARYVALAHTEGCGVSSGDSEELYLRTMAGYLCHPLVKKGLLLEHGCEKTHNDAMRGFLEQHGMDWNRFGCASVQMDGGLEKVTAKVMEWFHRGDPAETLPLKEVGLAGLRVGLMTAGAVSDVVASACATWAATITDAGGTVVIPQNSGLKDVFERELLASPESSGQPTLAYGQAFLKPGLHVMEAPTDHPVEILTGLGATGVEVILAHVTGPPLQSHPMIPMIQVSPDRRSEDIDLVLDLAANQSITMAEEMLKLVIRVAGREYRPRLFAQGNTDFQMTRGWLGVSL